MKEYKYTNKKLTPIERKERMQQPRNPIPEQPALERKHNFTEVNQGYSAEVAIKEAKRCLLCATAPCVQGCPVNIKIPEMLEKVVEGDFAAAYNILYSANSLPAITGRVCPQEQQCEGVCTLLKTSKSAVGIGYVERFLADYMGEKLNNTQVKSNSLSSNNKPKIAVVGSGPGGLTVAAELAKQGFAVHIFEAFHKPGGVLVYGIPEFRLPKAIVEREIKQLIKLGVTIHPNQVIGNLYTLDELLAEQNFAAIYIGIGAGLPKFMQIEGEQLNGIYSANEYLTRVNLMHAWQFPAYDTPVLKGKNVAVIGGGNVAMDAVRTAIRLGAASAKLIYRRSEAEMPARAEEVHHAKEEGVEFHFLTNPLRFIGNAENWVSEIECLKMQLSEPDASGRRRPIEIPGSNFNLQIDSAIIAVGTGPNPLLANTTKDIELNKWGYIKVDSEFRTSKKGVFAGGDIVRGAATVILAMGDAKQAAKAIQGFVNSKMWPEKFQPTDF